MKYINITIFTIITILFTFIQHDFLQFNTLAYQRIRDAYGIRPLSNSMMPSYSEIEVMPNGDAKRLSMLFYTIGCRKGKHIFLVYKVLYRGGYRGGEVTRLLIFRKHDQQIINKFSKTSGYIEYISRTGGRITPRQFNERFLCTWFNKDGYKTELLTVDPKIRMKRKARKYLKP